MPTFLRANDGALNIISEFGFLKVTVALGCCWVPTSVAAGSLQQEGVVPFSYRSWLQRGPH
jgi:hypothetical protein